MKKPHMKWADGIAIIAVLLMTLTSCVTMKEAPPLETFPQKLAFAYGLTDGIASTAEGLYRAEVLSEKETRDVYNTLQNVWAQLDKADKLYRDMVSFRFNDEKRTYAEYLASATKILETLRGFLMERSKRK